MSRKVFSWLFSFVIRWFRGCSTTAVVLEILQDEPGLVAGDVGPHLHVEHDGFPLRRRPLGRVTLGMAPVAMHRVKLRSGELMFQHGLLRLRRLAVHGC